MRDLDGTQWICDHPDLDSNTVSVTFKCVTFVKSLTHSDSQFSQLGNGVKNIQAEEFGGRWVILEIKHTVPSKCSKWSPSLWPSRWALLIKWFSKGGCHIINSFSYQLILFISGNADYINMSTQKHSFWRIFIVINVWFFIFSLYSKLRPGTLLYCCCSVAQSCPTLCDPVDCSTPGFPVLHHLPELAQTHVHGVSAIQPSHPLSSPSPPAFNLSQHQGLFQWISSLHQVAKVLELCVNKKEKKTSKHK